MTIMGLDGEDNFMGLSNRREHDILPIVVKIVGEINTMAQKISREQKLIYKALLPEKIKVVIHKAEEGGFWAKIDTYGATQGETFSELFYMITDLVYGYFDVPHELIPKLGSYFPADVIRKQVREQRPKQYTLDDILKHQIKDIKNLQRIV